VSDEVRHSSGLGRGLAALIPQRQEQPTSVELPIAAISRNPYQPRQDLEPEQLQALAASIAEHGVLQPILVTERTGGYLLIAGERRLRAAEMAGLERIPALVRPADAASQLAWALIENLQRADLNPLEAAHAFRQLVDEFGFSPDDVGARIGRSRSTVANTLRLLELPEPILTSLRSGDITAGHAKAVLSVTGDAQRSALWKRIVAEHLSVRQAEEIARAVAAPKKVPRQKPHPLESPQIRDYTDQLRRALGTQVHIRKRGRKGIIRIEFYSDEDLVRLMDILTREWEE